MRKIIILTFVLIASFVSLNTIFAATTPSIVDENTELLCSDGIDNNGDGNTDLQDVNCASFIPKPVFTENTELLCSDGIDNNGDGNTDLQDVNCASFIPKPVFTENTELLCSDGIDNNGDGNTDLQDVNCASFIPQTSTSTEATTTPVTTTPSGSTFSGPSFGGSSGPTSSILSGTPISSITSGSVISASSTATTTCADMFKTYMKKGKKNNVNEVKKLQKFLNIKVTGFFGDLTEKAVKAFQEKYADSVLTPWGLTKSTGYFYKTTQRQANLLLCSTADIPMPELK